MKLPALLLAAALLGGCAHPWNSVNLPPGTPRDQVLARAGQPVAVWPLADGGQRMVYTLQPTGQYAFAVDLDPQGRLVRSRQVLNELDFHRIQDDRWTRADVDREFGPPARIDGVWSWPGPIYTYRWYEHGDMLYHVYFDLQGVVRRHHPAIDHFGAPNDPRHP